MSWIFRLILLPVLIACACLLGAVYGAFHNQISYTVGPDYFHAFKFHQFAISADQHTRLGAAIVGVRASWWMGLPIGVPIALLSLAIPGVAHSVRSFAQAACLVVAVTLICGLASLLVTVPPDQYHLIRIPAGVADKAGFVRAGLMHDTSYAAGLLGLLCGVAFMLWRIRRARRADGAGPV